MRFRTQLKNTRTFSSQSSTILNPQLSLKLTTPEITASLSSLGKTCWMRLEADVVRFTIIPDQGTQVWSQIPVVRNTEPKIHTPQH